MAYRFLKLARSLPPHTWLALFVVLTSLLWAFWSTLGETAERWVHDPLYAHGFLVPVFALGLLWARWGEFKAQQVSPSWWGLPVLVGAAALRLLGAYFHFNWLDAISLLPCLAGLCLVIGGYQTLRWAWPAVLFLAFMIPLPFKVGEALADPLRALATPVCTFVLQTLGLPALAEGNRILMNDVDLDIVGQCSGLRMLVTSFALSTAVALMIRKPLWERLLIVASALPIALAANMARITATGILLETAGDRISHHAVHEGAGLAMMPLGLVLLGIELKYLKHLLIEPTAA
jgi:exosortase